MIAMACSCDFCPKASRPLRPTGHPRGRAKEEEGGGGEQAGRRIPVLSPSRSGAPHEQAGVYETISWCPSQCPTTGQAGLLPADTWYCQEMFRGMDLAQRKLRSFMGMLRIL